MTERKKKYNFTVHYFDERNQQDIERFENIFATNAIIAMEIANEILKKENKEWISKEYEIHAEINY